MGRVDRGLRRNPAAHGGRNPTSPPLAGVGLLKLDRTLPLALVPTLPRRNDTAPVAIP